MPPARHGIVRGEARYPKAKMPRAQFPWDLYHDMEERPGVVWTLGYCSGWAADCNLENRGGQIPVAPWRGPDISETGPGPVEARINTDRCRDFAEILRVILTRSSDGLEALNLAEDSGTRAA